MASEERFGYEWSKYTRIHPLYEHQFKTWIGSLAQGDFKDKDVLDAGCGMGRNSFWPLTYGARSVVAFDNDEQSLASARRTLAQFGNVTIKHENITSLPWKSEFDIVLCIGVLHHLRNPELALKNLSNALRPGGRLVVWVYGYEGNEWVPRFVSPIRTHITSRLPLSIVHGLSYLCSVPLWLFVKTFRGQRRISANFHSSNSGISIASCSISSYQRLLTTGRTRKLIC